MKVLYFDCAAGVSGDKVLGALFDLGVDRKMVLRELRKLPVDRIVFSVKKEKRHSIQGTSFKVRTREPHHHRTFRDIRGLIKKSPLAGEVKDLSIDIFRTIAEAEGKIHGVGAELVHFHEVGAMDSIIDIVGAAVALTSLKLDACLSSPVPLGSGWVDTMHGRMPVPAPATLEILRGVPVVHGGVASELTTPTGAAIIKTVCKGFGPVPPMVIEKTGYGVGAKDFEEVPNILRAVLGASEAGPRAAGPGAEELFVLETNIDDMSPQVAGYLLERLLEAGARDAFFTPVQMKKSRPAVLLTVLADSDKCERLLDIIFEESTSIGVRTYPVTRRCLERKTTKVKTRYGTIRVKVSMSGGRVVNAQPEYEDMKAAARKKGAPLKAVIDAARAAIDAESSKKRRLF